MSGPLSTGNFTYVAEKVNLTGGELLFNLFWGTLIIFIFIYITWYWTTHKKQDPLSDDIKEIKTNVATLVKETNKKKQKRSVSK